MQEALTGSFRMLFIVMFLRQEEPVCGVVWMGHKGGEKHTSLFEGGSGMCWKNTEQVPLA